MRSLAALLACTLVITPVDAYATGPQPTDHEAAHLVADRPPDAARVDADLEVILHTRGTEYAQAHARLVAAADLATARIAVRLAATPARATADEQRLWALLAELAPAQYVANLRAQLRPPPPVRPAPPRVTRLDPRMDPRWAARDRMLTKGVIATGVLFGLATIAVSLAIGIPVATAEPSPGTGIDGPPPGLLLFIAVAVPAAIPLTTFASVRRKHRRPLRAHEVSLAGAGFRLRF